MSTDHTTTYTIDQNRRHLEFRQMRETLDRVTQQLATANHERETQHATIKDLTGKVEELTSEVQMLRNLKATDTSLLRALTEDLETERERTQDLTTTLEESKRVQDTLRRGFDGAHRQNNELQARFNMLRAMTINALSSL